MSRKPVQIVEIDIDYCTLSYGSAPCGASLSAINVRKCFNTFFTCQDTNNFDKGLLTLRFSKNQNGLPKGTLIYPALKSVSTNPTKINLGGIDQRTGPLGKRARVTINLQDFTDNDTQTDKYQSGRVDGSAQFSGYGYNPEPLGTFFGKLRRRYPYYIGRALRVLEGYDGQPLVSMRTRNYVISEWSGPDMSGRIVIIAKDILDLADNEKALCPKPSIGKIGAGIATTGTPVVTLTPVGSGADYAAYGRASIGSEIVTFTRSGDDVTITARGLDGSAASSHAAGDLFQQCYRVERQAIDAVASDLLENFAGIGASYIPTADWSAEMLWLVGYEVTATIAKPTGVTKLLGELAQHGVFWWWDDLDQKIKLRANRPADFSEAITEVTDKINVIEGSLKTKDMINVRLTQVVFWHGQIDATGSATSGENFTRARVVVNDGGNTNKHNQERILEIYSRWLDSGNDSVAGAVASRLSARYVDAPRQVTFKIDAKDRGDISVGALIVITTRAMQDDTGASLPTEMQVVSVDEHIPGHALTVVAQTHEFSGRFGFVTENSRPDYDVSTPSEIKTGTYIVGPSLVFADGTNPYLMF